MLSTVGASKNASGLMRVSYINEVLLKCLPSGYSMILSEIHRLATLTAQL